MKKIIILAALFCTLFSTAAFAEREPVTDVEKVSQIISDYYPGISGFYEDGLINVQYLMEETLADGSTEYNIRYRFVKSYYEQAEADKILKEKYPYIYAMKRMGLIKDVGVYRIVNKDTKEIVTNVEYKRAERRMHRPMRRSHNIA